MFSSVLGAQLTRLTFCITSHWLQFSSIKQTAEVLLRAVANGSIRLGIEPSILMLGPCFRFLYVAVIKKKIIS